MAFTIDVSVNLLFPQSCHMRQMFIIIGLFLFNCTLVQAQQKHVQSLENGAEEKLTKQGKTTVCATTINTYPYRESFETSSGNWVAGGNASDWAWGTPSKSIILSAGDGAKCWITGGLTGSSYNGGEYSYLESPCFDFSTLVHPRFTVKIFWETERKYDGAHIQYSTDDGLNWLLLGDFNSNVQCRSENWYNGSNVIYLQNTTGWTGSAHPDQGSCLGGAGSGWWKTAWHEMDFLAGAPSVKFRIYFAAGTTCNAYDGFAVDDIRIDESAMATPGFSYNCEPGRKFTFTTNATCISSISWNFGDPSSGASNTANVQSPQHIFSAAGNFDVTATINYTHGAPGTYHIPVMVVDVSTIISQPGTCQGNAAATITANVSGNTSPVQYVWSTSPQQTTPSISNMPPGTYHLSIMDGANCSAAIDAVVKPLPPPMQWLPAVSPAGCTSAGGGIVPNISGGTPPYQYQWSNGSTAAALVNVPAGSYTLNVTDSNGCVFSKTAVVGSEDNVSVFLGRDTVICPGQKLVLSPGNFAAYLWQDGSSAGTYTVASGGTYTVTVTTSGGCKGTDAITVYDNCDDLYFPNAFTPNGDLKNDWFGPAGNGFPIVSAYELYVYNRYGQLVFYSDSPLKKWNGKFKGLETANETFVWMASYKINGAQKKKKGFVILIR